jgi:hypothetical protein
VRGAAVSRHTLPLAAVLAAAILAALPEWRPVWYQDDQLPVIFRVLHTDLAHHHGVWYPRLAPELGFGYGRLLHQFYPPLGVELAAWLHALGLEYLTAARATYSLCLLSSALGMYAFGLAVLRAPARATLAAVAYVWAPYVLLDAHRGGVLGESLALALMPWSLLAVHLLVERGGWGRLALAALGLAAINVAHNITALFFTGLVLVYALVLALRRRPPRAIRWAIGAVVLSLGLSAGYWLPALVELPYSNLGEQRKGSFSIGRYLVEPGELFQRSFVFDYYDREVPPYGLVAGLLTLGAAVAFAAAVARRRAVNHDRSKSPWPDLPAGGSLAVAFCAMLLLQLEPTLVLWETVPLVSFIQFPQRLFVFASFAGAVTIGTLPWALEVLLGDDRGRLKRAAPAVSGEAVALLLGATSLPGVWWTPPVSDSHRISEDQIGLGTVAERRLSERSAYDDYFPVGVEESANQIPEPPSRNKAEEYEASNDGAVPTIRLVERGYLRTRLETSSAVASSVVFHTFYFPGWQAHVDGQPVPIDTISPIGVARVALPPGDHMVTFEFAETPLRLAANLLTAVSAIALLLALARGFGVYRTMVGAALCLAVVTVPWLLHLQLEPIARPPPSHLDLQVTPNARLVAVELGRERYAAGEALEATLIWQATRHTAADQRSGLRLEALGGGAPIAEAWVRPGREMTPTGKWILGELIPDPISLEIPTEAPSGRYRLSAGLRERGSTSAVPIAEIEIRR